MRTITIELPDTINISGLKDAPEKYKTVSTKNWDQAFILDAAAHGVGQACGDTWSVSKKDKEKLAAKHKAMEDGEWSRRVKGTVTEKLSKLSGSLSMEELKAWYEAEYARQEAAKKAQK